ncbi:MAG: DUF904 domain-containing protein, partial [Herbaspirillum sp.]
QLADLTQSLRQQNAELRQQTLTLQAEKTDLTQRMLQAQQRIAVLLESVPSTTSMTEQESV